MRPLVQHIATSFSCGVFGALLACLLLWVFGVYGLNASLGVALSPGLSLRWLYPYLVWGGIWALLFLLPWRNAWFARGILLSLPPLLVQLFILFPRSGSGIAGLGLGALTPLVIFLVFATWGLVSSFVLRYLGR